LVWPPREVSHSGTIGERILLGKDKRGCRGLCANLYHLSARKIRQGKIGRVFEPFANCEDTLDECFDGLHYSVSTGTGV